MAEMSNQKIFTQATLADVARKAGVSTATVSRVINHTGQVAQETIERVNQVIAEIGYRPHASARNLASGRTYTIGFISENLGSTFFAELLDGIEEAASEQDFSLLIHTTRGKPSSGPDYHRPLAAHDTDGIIAFIDTLEKDELAYLEQIQFPVVMLLQTPDPALNIPYVVFENQRSACLLTEHLIAQHGSRRIAFIRGEKNQEDSYNREKGYRAALERHGIPVDPELISEFGDLECAEQTIHRWIDQGLKIDAIFNFDDDRAVRTISILQNRGVRVPEDIRVIGFDDIPLTKFFAPPLTTVAAPVRQAGFEAARQLLNKINGRKTARKTVLPTDIVIRRSCGCHG
jgi:DNA-binding LacI/PurR family transcriptional regulator